MSINEEEPQAQWRAAIARIAAQIDDLKVRIDSESRTLHTSLSAEIAALRSELRKLEAEVDAAVPDSYAQQIAAQIDDLRAKGDAAYSLLQAGEASRLDPTDAEIRQLEAAAATASESARARIMARIDELKAAQVATQASTHRNSVSQQDGGIAP